MSIRQAVTRARRGTAPAGLSAVRTATTPLAAVVLNELVRKGWTQVTLAEQMGCSTKHLNQLLHSRTGFSPDMALRMEHQLTIPAELLQGLWLVDYRETWT